MNAPEIRDELLKQHAALRAQIARARRDVEAWSRGEFEPLQMRKEIEGLSSAMLAHNLREEELLREATRSDGASSDGRRGIMDERHRDEHAELNTALALTRIIHPPVRIGGRSSSVMGGRAVEVRWPRSRYVLSHTRRQFNASAPLTWPSRRTRGPRRVRRMAYPR